MSANIEESEISLLDWAVEWFRERLPENWSLDLMVEVAEGPMRADGRLVVQASGGYTASIVVEARRSLTPKEAENLLSRLARLLHSMTGEAPVLIVAPWLSQRTQELLAAQKINYIDQTGNALISLENPAVYIKTTGALRNPSPKERGRVQLRGPKAGRLLRTLIDVRPPYTVKDLAGATDLAPGYVSRTIDALDADALIRREPRGPVEAVDVPAMLRRWARSYDVFKTNQLSTFIAAEGWERTLADLSAEPALRVQAVLTGSYAAAQLAPVASPAMLLAYSAEPERLARELGLLPADEGANVGLLWPYDPVVWVRTRDEKSLRIAAPSQVAVDCLTGNGRMPAEGEALIAWMVAHERNWRLPELENLDRWER
jgi:hypothetical protein